MRTLDHAAFEKLNSQSARVISELNEWSEARKSPLLLYGQGFSHMAYSYMKAPDLKVRNHRDYWHNVDSEKTQILSLELAIRGFFPVHRGELSLSLPMADDDISSFIETLKEIVEDLES